MSSRKPSQHDARVASAPQFASADWPRQQMALWTGGACALIRGFEAIRRIQLKTAHQALAHHQATAEKLREPCSLTDLMALQADLARFDAQGAALYWQQLGAIALETQRQMMGSFAQGAEAETEEAAASMQAYAAAMPNLAEFFQGNGAARARH